MHAGLPFRMSSCTDACSGRGTACRFRGSLSLFSLVLLVIVLAVVLISLPFVLASVSLPLPPPRAPPQFLGAPPQLLVIAVELRSPCRWTSRSLSMVSSAHAWKSSWHAKKGLPMGDMIS